MQCASSTTSSPTRSANSGSIVSRNCGLLSRSGLISSRSTASVLEQLADLGPGVAVGRVDRVRADPELLARRRSGCASAPAAARRSAPGRRPARAAARWRGSRRRTCPSRCAGRTARGRGRPRDPSPPRAGARGTAPPGPARRFRSSSGRLIPSTVGGGPDFSPPSARTRWSARPCRAGRRRPARVDVHRRELARAGAHRPAGQGDRRAARRDRAVLRAVGLPARPAVGQRPPAGPRALRPAALRAHRAPPTGRR